MGNRTPIGFERLFFANTAKNSLKIPTGIPCEIFLVLTKNGSFKTAQHPTVRFFALDFCADDTAWLTQGKENKEKYK